MHQYSVDAGERAGVTGEEREELERLRRENAELRRANEILKTGLGFLRAGARPVTAEVVAYIDEHRQVFGVEPICVPGRPARLDEQMAAPAGASRQR